jgi:ankyrin repeat protein
MMVLMSDEAAVLEITNDDPRTAELVLAIHGGDVETVRRHLAADPALARAVIGDRKGCRTLLHVVADWPGYFPNGPELVRLLIGAGADPSFRDPTRCDETALHWAASSDDVDVAAALIDGGADLDVPGGSIGTPLANAVGYGCWHVARLLVARGARIGSLWEAAALGDRAAVDGFLEGDRPAGDEIDAAFWQACNGGQRRMAEYLLDRGADINAIPDYAGQQTALEAAGSVDTQRQILVDWLKERGGAGG